MTRPLDPPERAAAASPNRRASAWRSALPLLPPALLLGLCWLTLTTAHATFTQPWPFQALFALAFAIYCWAVAVSLRVTALSGRAQTALTLGVALLLHLALLPAPQAFSDDIFRYVWDGRVSAAGIDPYRYPPGAPELTPLRDTAIWPAVNAKDQPSPYPPLLETLFALVYRLRPESLLAMKLAMVALNMAVIGLLALLLRARGQPPLRAIIYAWNPQVVFQVAFSGHNEPLLLVCLLGALLASQGPLARQMADQRTPLLTGWLLGLAALAKFVPLIVLPVLLRRRGPRVAAVALATVGAVYGGLLLRGQHVFDGVAVEIGDAQFNDGLYYLLYRLARLGWPERAHDIASTVAAGMMGLVLLALLRAPGRDLAMPIGALLATYVALAASVAPWYALWVLPFVALDALPRLPGDRRGPLALLLGGYWLLFSWTASFSELFYSSSTAVWRVAHIVEYAVPAGAMAAVWLRARLRRAS